MRLAIVLAAGRPVSDALIYPVRLRPYDGCNKVHFGKLWFLHLTKSERRVILYEFIKRLIGHIK